MRGAWGLAGSAVTSSKTERLGADLFWGKGRRCQTPRRILLRLAEEFENHAGLNGPYCLHSRRQYMPTWWQNMP
eukprot:scaffold28336_cov16-Tisochrysis_lutea.AAC.1